jgi:RNA polymerase sigma-70 factor (ECF subfamily)
MFVKRMSERAAPHDPLAGRLASGDPKAPRELVDRQHAELYRYARYLLGSGPAEDAVQETFARAFGALGRYPEERIRGLALRPWLYRILLNVVRNHRRDGRWESPVAEVPEQVSGQDSTSPEARIDALAALGALPERQRTAVALRYLQDLPYAEVSAATGWPEATCRTLVRRGLARLAALLEVEKDGGS